MSFTLIGMLLFLISINLTSGLKRKEKIKIILFLLLFGLFMIFFTSSISELLENPIVQNIIK